MYSRTNIKGMITAVLRRSSSKGQGTSIGNQARTVDSVIAEQQLQVIKEYVLEGVSGSIPGTLLGKVPLELIPFRRAAACNFSLRRASAN